MTYKQCPSQSDYSHVVSFLDSSLVAFSKLHHVLLRFVNEIIQLSNIHSLRGKERTSKMNDKHEESNGIRNYITLKRTMYQRKVDVDMLNTVKSVLADVSSVSPTSRQGGTPPTFVVECQRVH